VTSLGAETQLWDPRRRDFSALARRQGWAEKFPPLRNAWDVLGTLQFEIARTCALPHDIPVLCGIHDDGASFARYLAAGLDDFTLISTGASLIALRPGLPLERLDPLRDTMSRTDLLGRPVACARFMRGRDYAAIAGVEPAAGDVDGADVEALIAAATMALPSFGRDGGPFPGTGGQGRIIGPMPKTPRARAALASLYVALMADAALDLLDSRRRIVVDGRFLRDRLFLGLLAALRPEQPVLASPERAGTAIGAALLWGWTERSAPVRLELTPVAPLRVPGLADYARSWRAAAGGSGHP
jgi:sugar (pentulose or hexulose) kinase